MSRMQGRIAARYLVGGPGWSGAGPVVMGPGVLLLSADDPQPHPLHPQPATKLPAAA